MRGKEWFGLWVAIAVTSLSAGLVGTPAPAMARASTPAIALPSGLQLPFASGATWLANGPHGDGANGTGTAYSVDLGPKGGGNGTVLAAGGGTARISGACAIDIDHGSGWSTRYQHLGPFTGAYPRTVKAGDQLGITEANQTGSTCNNNGYSHVHFGILQNGVPVPITGLSIGGYTVHGTGTPYLGTWTRNADGATVVTVPPSGNTACCIVNNQSSTAAPANVQYAIATADGGLWHTIRFANGTWQAKGDLKSKLGLSSNTTAVAETYDPTNVQYVIATADGGLWWTARLANGTWAAKRDLRATLGLTSATTAVATTWDGGNVQFVIATADGGLWWTARIASNSTWVAKRDLRATLGLTSNTTAVAATYDGGNLQFVIATADGGLWWTARLAKGGTWVAKRDLRATLGLTSASVAVAAEWDGTNLQFVIATADGGLWWTARIASNSTWVAKRDLRATLGLTSNTRAVSAAYSTAGLQVAIATADGGLWHTIRSPTGGTWQAKGNLASKLGLTSATAAIGASI